MINDDKMNLFKTYINDDNKAEIEKLIDGGFDVSESLLVALETDWKSLGIISFLVRKGADLTKVKNFLDESDILFRILNRIEGRMFLALDRARQMHSNDRELMSDTEKPEDLPDKEQLLSFMKLLVEKEVDLTVEFNNAENEIIASPYAHHILDFINDHGNIINKKKQDLLFKAAEKHNLDAVKYLVKIGADISHKNWDNTSVLSCACTSFQQAENIDLIQFIVQSGVEIDQSAVINAAKNCYLSTFKYLIENGANPNIVGEGGETAFVEACGSSKQSEVAEYLVDYVKDINKSVTIWGGILGAISDAENISPLMVAVSTYDDGGNGSKSRFVLIKKMISKGADVNHIDKEGKNVLMYSVMACHKDMQVYTIQKQRQKTVFEECYRPVMQLLIDKGVSVSLADNNKKTAIDYAGHFIIREYLNQFNNGK